MNVDCDLGKEKKDIARPGMADAIEGLKPQN